MDLAEILTYPHDNDLLLRKQKSIRRQLLARKNIDYIRKKIAILSGSTVDDIINILEIFLLENGIQPIFYKSEYNKFYEESVFNNSKLDDFKPDIIIVFTSIVNLLYTPNLSDSTENMQEHLDNELQRYHQIWHNLNKKYGAMIIQNNFDIPYISLLGNLDGVSSQGLTTYVNKLNLAFSQHAQQHTNFFIHDLNALSAKIGGNKWHNRFQYYAYKFAMNYDVFPDVALGLSKIIKGILGKNKKCLILDLDNTLWGGIIGDAGVENIVIGHETPAAEAYTEFQKYVKKLKERGIILAVCSKNDESIARSGFNHPDSVLSSDDFIVFKANWQSKDINIIEIAQEINIGLDSLVFIDDNPVERAIVRRNIPEVAVPEVDSNDVFSYIRLIEGAGYFEPINISQDDLTRNQTYLDNKKRKILEASVGNYDDFLRSLNMDAEIYSFKSVYYERIAQLTNKSNQFNLTTRRYTLSEIEHMANNSSYITLYGRLTDCFGDNGLVSVVIGEKRDNTLHILLWLMSCRVLKRGMEYAMYDELIRRAMNIGIDELVGYYYPTKKNTMVSTLYDDLGFSKIIENDKETRWKISVTNYVPKNKFIAVNSKLSLQTNKNG